MTKHTLGEWTTEEVGGAIAIIADDLAIAHVRAVYSDERRTAPANARLMAAAPTMYDALKAVDTEGRDANSNGDVTIPSEIWDLVQQAIAKATA